MSEQTCSVFGCERPSHARGLCNTHYERLRIHGSTDDPTPTTEKRFWAKVDVGDCWEWTATRHPQGHGMFTPPQSNPVYAHRFAYELLVGPIPPGLTLDHLCRNRGCVNPDHLQPVTQRVNVLRGDAPAARTAERQSASTATLTRWRTRTGALTELGAAAGSAYASVERPHDGGTVLRG